MPRDCRLRPSDRTTGSRKGAAAFGLAWAPAENIVTNVNPNAATNPPLTADAPCPCGSGKAFGACCEPLLKQVRKAETAEQLMRSRFTAHYVRDYRHLHRTYLETAKKPYVEETAGGDVQWTRLVIHAHDAGAKPETAFVDFSAYFEEGGREHAMHEKSEFVKIDGEWFFKRPIRSGPAPVKSTTPKVGRNDPCPCGSGKKFKQCCGR